MPRELWGSTPAPHHAPQRGLLLRPPAGPHRRRRAAEGFGADVSAEANADRPSAQLQGGQSSDSVVHRQRSAFSAAVGDARHRARRTRPRVCPAVASVPQVASKCAETVITAPALSPRPLQTDAYPHIHRKCTISCSLVHPPELRLTLSHAHPHLPRGSISSPPSPPVCTVCVRGFLSVSNDRECLCVCRSFCDGGAALAPCKKTYIAVASGYVELQCLRGFLSRRRASLGVARKIVKTKYERKVCTVSLRPCGVSPWLPSIRLLPLQRFHLSFGACVWLYFSSHAPPDLLSQALLFAHAVWLVFFAPGSFRLPLVVSFPFAHKHTPLRSWRFLPPSIR
eukprot:RCo022397